MYFENINVPSWSTTIITDQEVEEIPNKRNNATSLVLCSSSCFFLCVLSSEFLIAPLVKGVSRVVTDDHKEEELELLGTDELDGPVNNWSEVNMMDLIEWFYRRIIQGWNKLFKKVVNIWSQSD